MHAKIKCFTVLVSEIKRKRPRVCTCASDVCYSVTQKTITSAGQAMSVYERQMLWSIREVFVVFVLVFYVW